MKNVVLRFLHLGFASLLLLVSVAARQAPVLPAETPVAATHKAQRPKSPPVLRELSPMTAAPAWHVAFVQNVYLLPPPVSEWLLSAVTGPLPRPLHKAYRLHYREVLFEHFLSTNGP